jgi:hypothetical protein
MMMNNYAPLENLLSWDNGFGSHGIAIVLQVV